MLKRSLHNHRFEGLAVAVACALLSSVCVGQGGDDWPQFLGPRRDGVYRGGPLAEQWPASGPSVLWRVKVGQGLAGPAVADGKVILFHRVDDEDVVQCMAAASGQVLWRFAYATDYRDDFGFDEGPRAVPTIADGIVYTFGAQGMLHALDLATGKVLWRVDTRGGLRSGKGFFGRACSPMVEGDLVLMNLGGQTADGPAGLVAFDRRTGAAVWQQLAVEAGYASPVAATIHGRRYAFFFTRHGLTALQPETGKIDFSFRWRSRMNASVNAALPVVVRDRVFVSACYGVGAKVIRVSPALANHHENIWAAEDRMDCHYATPVHHKGYLYGFHGRQEFGCELRCIRLADGQVQWKQSMPAGVVIIAGDTLLVLQETGKLIKAPADPGAFEGAASADILAGVSRPYPALAGGLFFARDTGELVCVDLRPQ